MKKEEGSSSAAHELFPMRSTERQRKLFQHLSAAITSVPVLQGKDLSMWPEKQDSVAVTSQKLASLPMELETDVVSAIWDPTGAGKMLGNRRETRRVTRTAWQLLPASGMLPGKAGFWRKEVRLRVRRTQETDEDKDFLGSSLHQHSPRNEEGQAVYVKAGH